MQRSPYFPMMSERINDPSETPAMGISHWTNLRRPGTNGLRTNRRRIFHPQKHANRTSAQCFGTEIFVRRGFFSDPELRARNGQLTHTTARDAIQFPGAKCRLVKIHCSRPVPDGQRGGDDCAEAAG